jgi:hypothetical protein
VSVGEPTVEVKLEERTKKQNRVESVWLESVEALLTKMMARTEARRAT